MCSRENTGSKISAAASSFQPFSVTLVPGTKKNQARVWNVKRPYDFQICPAEKLTGAETASVDRPSWPGMRDAPSVGRAGTRGPEQLAL